MAASPDLKVFCPQGEYVAACKRYEDAACLASFYGDGATIRLGHAKRLTLWTEGAEEFGAGESYDRAANVMADRRFQLNRAALVKVHGEETVARWAQATGE